MSTTTTTASNQKKLAASNSVVSGKTARACDSCVKRRARWYCPADDAFLCQACDHSVHSANSLAKRHERVRLKTASSSSCSLNSLKPCSPQDSPTPTWHQGFTRKARTPRQHGKHVTTRRSHNNKFHKSKAISSSNTTTVPNPFSLVPEVSGDYYETSHEENDEQLLYRVPIFDPLFVAELCGSPPAPAATVENINVEGGGGEVESSSSKVTTNTTSFEACRVHHEVGSTFLPSEMELAEFAADVENLLGRGLDENECFGIEGLGLVDCSTVKQKETTSSDLNKGRAVKIEEELEEEGVAVKGGCWVESTEIDMMREPFELNFDDYDDDSPASCGEDEEEEDDKVLLEMKNDGESGVNDDKRSNNYKKVMMMKKMKKKKKKKIVLRLDYEAVITAWASQGSPWTTGDRPDFDPDASWPDSVSGASTCGAQLHHQHYYTELGGIGGNPSILGDGEREARVSRYREKRRTRLFSKKIRYEVRKLNAEKRPRMKGRFVKRASFTTGPTFPMLNT